jgi:hypothetical protein
MTVYTQDVGTEQTAMNTYCKLLAIHNRNKPWRPIGLRDFEDPTLARRLPLVGEVSGNFRG